jgi:hypothetical protein
MQVWGAGRNGCKCGAQGGTDASVGRRETGGEVPGRGAGDSRVRVQCEMEEFGACFQKPEHQSSRTCPPFTTKGHEPA